MDGYFIKKIGSNRGSPRVWLEGLQTEKAGFTPGQRYDISVEGQTVVLQANPDGSRVVSSKKIGERSNPIIDLNSKELLAVFDGMAAIRVAVKKEGQIYLVPLASELKKQERFKRLREKLENGTALQIGSLSHGAGIMSHAIHTGLNRAGIPSHLKFANEIREELLDHASIHNDAWSKDTIPFAAPMQELSFDERGLSQVPRVEILEMGLPCSAASLAGLASKGHKIPESHEHVGHLVVASLIILNKANPAIVIYENVPNYANTASAAILRNQLRDLGYVTHERILNGKEWGALENRDRWCMVAATNGLHFSFDQLMPPQLQKNRLGDILDDVPLDDPSWRTMDGLKEKEKRDLSLGKGFKMQVVDENSTSIGTIGKGYNKNRSTEPKILHPQDPALLRLLTPQEHSRAKQIPFHLVSALPNTTAHEALGQAVLYNPFRDVGHHVGNAINRFMGRAEIFPVHSNQSTSAAYEDIELQQAQRIADGLVSKVERANTMQGRYSGPVIASNEVVFVQDVGRGEGVMHLHSSFKEAPKLNTNLKVHYSQGSAIVQMNERSQMVLDL